MGGPGTSQGHFMGVGVKVYRLLPAPRPRGRYQLPGGQLPQAKPCCSHVLLWLADDPVFWVTWRKTSPPPPQEFKSLGLLHQGEPVNAPPVPLARPPSQAWPSSHSRHPCQARCCLKPPKRRGTHHRLGLLPHLWTIPTVKHSRQCGAELGFPDCLS